MHMMRWMVCGLLLLMHLPYAAHGQDVEPSAGRPNILLCLSDDQSYPHASAYGTPVIRTPVFDRLAREGVLFTQAYCASPSCTPSRSALLTGQDIWRLGPGGQLFGALPAEHPVYTDLLEQAGYFVGYSRKGWAPGRVGAGGRQTNPAGSKQFKSFENFLNEAPQGEPWCFWFGSRDPHRGYKQGSGIASGMDPKKVRVPPVYPDTPEVRSDLCDYFLEIQRFDREVGELLALLEQAGQLDNTIVVVTSDNGMPFPRAKANLYDLGARMPLVIRWPGKFPAGRAVDDFVNLTDLAPTFLQAAGLEPPEQMTGKSLMPILESKSAGRVDPARDFVVTGREHHAWCRIDGKGYPARMIRTEHFLYIRNYEPQRWPAGTYRIMTNEGHYGDIDNSPTKNQMIAGRDNWPGRFDLSFGKRPAEELYDCRKDPYQTNNLAEDPAYQETLKQLSQRMNDHLKATGDPRVTEEDTPWDALPYYGNNRWKVLPEAQ